jgi:hypothetical protein
MADITMCEWTNCPMKDKCYRYTAPKSERQTMFIEIPLDKETDMCEHFYINE